MRELGDRRPGAEQTCIDERRANDTVVFPGAILFRQSGQRIWRMTPDDRCPFLRWDVHLQFYSNGGRLCRGDRFAVYPPGSTIPLGHCRMGGFVPYDKERP